MNKEHPTAEVAPLMAHDPLNTFLEDGMMDKDLGALSGSKATPEAPTDLRPSGYDPGENKS